MYRNTTLIGTSSGLTFDYGAWYYFEMKFKLADSPDGYITLWLNGNQILNETSIDLLEGSDAYARRFIFRGVCSHLDVCFDDLYILDTDGDAPYNDRLGDIRVDAIRPSGAGSHTEFTPSAGSNYENVDGDYPDDDTTYNDGDTTNDEDSYAMDNLPSPSGTTIYGVKSQITARKTDAGDRKCKIIRRVGGSDYLGDEETLSDSFQTFTKID